MAIEKINKPTLHAVRDKRDAWKCSACGADFSGSKMQLVNSFGAHVRQQHKPAPKEDVDQAAARILREAAEGK
jgi:ribosomal protein L37AE/L43A